MPDSYPPEASLGAWARAAARGLLPRHRFVGEARADADAWRERLGRDLAEALALPAEVEPAAPRVVWEAAAAPHSQVLLEARDLAGPQGRAWMLVPPAVERPVPGILLLMGGPLARDTAVGYAGRAGRDGYRLAHDLALAGYAVLVPDLPAVMALAGDSVDGAAGAPSAAVQALLAVGRTLGGLQVATALAWGSYLAGRPDVSAGHVGVVGMGEGSRVGTLAAITWGACAGGETGARAPETAMPEALALCGGWSPWLPALRAGEACHGAAAMPGLMALADWPDLVLAAWRRGLHLEAADGSAEAAVAREMATMLREARDDLGHSETPVLTAAQPGLPLPAEDLAIFLEQWLLIPWRGQQTGA